VIAQKKEGEETMQICYTKERHLQKQNRITMLNSLDRKKKRMPKEQGWFSCST
jgi:hypothetical protein